MYKMIDVDFGSSRYDALVNLRYKVLLEPLGLKFLEHYRPNEASYLHIGCIDQLDDKLVGGLILAPVDNEEIRMMQVAVDDEYQHKGIGHEMVAYAEKHVPKKPDITNLLCMLCFLLSGFMNLLVLSKRAKFLTKEGLRLRVWSNLFKLGITAHLEVFYVVSKNSPTIL